MCEFMKIGLGVKGRGCGGDEERGLKDVQELDR